MKQTALLFAAALSLAACASSAPADPRIAETRANVSRERTEFDEYTRYQGPQLALSAPEGFALVRSWRENADDVPVHQLYLHISHPSQPREFLSASMVGGKALAVKNLDQGKRCKDGTTSEACPVYEDAAVMVKDSYLRKVARKDGLKIRFNAKRGEDVVVTVPAWYLQGYLDAF